MKKAQSIRKCRKMMLLLFSGKGKIFFRNLHYKFTFRFRPLLSTSKRYLMEKMKNVTNLIARKIKETPYYLRSLTYRFFFQSPEIRRSTQYQVITKEKENMWFFLLRGNEVFVWNIVLFCCATFETKNAQCSTIQCKVCTRAKYSLIWINYVYIRFEWMETKVVTPVTEWK